MTARACSTCRWSTGVDCTNPNDVPGLEAWLATNEVAGVLVEGADGCPGWSGLAPKFLAAIAQRAQLVALVTAEPGISTPEIAQRLGLPMANLTAKLRGAGLVSRVAAERRRPGAHGRGSVANVCRWFRDPVEAILDPAPDVPGLPSPRATGELHQEADAGHHLAGAAIGGDAPRVEELPEVTPAAPLHPEAGPDAGGDHGGWPERDPDCPACIAEAAAEPADLGPIRPDRADPRSGYAVELAHRAALARLQESHARDVAELVAERDEARAEMVRAAGHVERLEEQLDELVGVLNDGLGTSSYGIALARARQLLARPAPQANHPGLLAYLLRRWLADPAWHGPQPPEELGDDPAVRAAWLIGHLESHA